MKEENKIFILNFLQAVVLVYLIRFGIEKLTGKDIFR